MAFSFDNNVPIYIQIVEQIKIDIVSGKMSPGERLPSVRDFALAMKVNPNTMQKALQELEETGLVYTERTNGKFVTNDISLINKHKNEYAEFTAQKYLAAMAEIGYSPAQAAEYLKKGVK